MHPDQVGYRHPKKSLNTTIRNCHNHLLTQRVVECSEGEEQVIVVLRCIILPLLLTLALASPPEALADQLAQSPREHYRAGLQYYRDGNNAQALSQLKAAIAKCPPESPTYADAHWVLGWVQAALADWQGASESFARFVELRPDDLRSGQARSLADRLCGNRSESPRDQAMTLLSEAQEALAGFAYDRAFRKARMAAGLMPNDPGVHLTLAGALSGMNQWQAAFEHSEIAVNLESSAVNRAYRILYALAREHADIARGYNSERFRDAEFDFQDQTLRDHLQQNHRSMVSITGNDGTRQAKYMIGMSLATLATLLDAPEQSRGMLLWAHLNLARALESPDLTPSLRPEANQWIAELTGFDILSPQTEIEWQAYEEQSNWNMMVETENVTHGQIIHWRNERLDQYTDCPQSSAEYLTGLLLAVYDKLVWRHEDSDGKQLAALHLHLLTKLYRRTVDVSTDTSRIHNVMSIIDDDVPGEWAVQTILVAESRREVEGFRSRDHFRLVNLHENQRTLAESMGVTTYLREIEMEMGVLPGSDFCDRRVPLEIRIEKLVGEVIAHARRKETSSERFALIVEDLQWSSLVLLANEEHISGDRANLDVYFRAMEVLEAVRD